MTSRRYTRNPGQDQVAAWKAELARQAKIKRRQRWKRRRGLDTAAGPGMVRRRPPTTQDHPATPGGETPKE
jgi:hypothetical protein